MALITVHEGVDKNWRRTFNDESPRDRFNRKLAQAEALSATLCGGGDEGFRSMNDVIQDNVLWLLSDLITEIREAHEAADLQERGA